MKRPVPLRKLSQLQRLILVMLLDPRLASSRRRKFRELAKGIYWGALLKVRVAPNVATSALCRALSRLEGRGYIARTRQGWRLTEFQLGALTDCGDVMALCAWEQQKELYTKLELRPGLSPEPVPEKKGVQVSLKF
jgi:hypothetical protein